MTQKQWKMISTIISIIIVVVFALYKAFGVTVGVYFAVAVVPFSSLT